MKKVFSFALGLFVLSNTLMAQSDANKNKKEKQETATDDKSLKIVFARELVKEFQKDESLANEQYLNKVVVVKGKLKEISKNDKGNTVVIIKSDDPFSSVHCTLKEATPIDLKPGSPVSVKGTVEGFLSDVTIIDASITK